MVEKSMANITDLVRPSHGSALHVLGHAVGAEDAAAVTTMMLALVHGQRNLAVLTVLDIIFVLPSYLQKKKENKHYFMFIS